MKIALNIDKHSEIVMVWSIYCLLFALPFSKAIVEIFSIVAIIAWATRKIILFVRNKNIASLAVRPQNVFLGLMGYILCLAASVIVSRYVGLSIEAFLCKSLEHVLLFIIAIEAFNSHVRIIHLLYVLIISACVIASDAITQATFGIDFIRRQGLHGKLAFDVRACFTNPNAFAVWILMIWPLLIGILSGNIVKTKLWRIVLGVGVGLLPFCLYATGSRAGWAVFFLQCVLIFMLFFSLMIKKRHNPKRIAILICMAIFVAFMIMFTLQRGYSVTMFSRDARMTLWNEAIAIIKEYPFFGAGLNTYAKVVNDYTVKPGGSSYPHNSYLHMAADSGIITVGAFFGLMITVYAYSLRSKEAFSDTLLLGFMIGITGILIHAFFDTTFYQLQTVILFWVMLGITVAYARLKREETHA